MRDGLAGIADEVDLWESIYDDAYVKKDAVGAAHDEQHAIGYKADEAEDYDDALKHLSAEDMITNWSAYISSYSNKLWPRSTIEHWVRATDGRSLPYDPNGIRWPLECRSIVARSSPTCNLMIVMIAI